MFERGINMALSGQIKGFNHIARDSQCIYILRGVYI
jgi:hypothetical protein